MTDADVNVRVRRVEVTNNLPFPFTDRFNGVPYRIGPGEKLSIPLEEAEHFFGFHLGVAPETMLRHIAKRQGWNTPEHVKQNPETKKTLAEEYFQKLVIHPVTYKLVRDPEPDPVKPIPAEQERSDEDDTPRRALLGGRRRDQA